MEEQKVAVNLWLGGEGEIKRDVFLSAVPRVGDKVAFTSGAQSYIGTVQEVIFHADGNARVMLGSPLEDA